MTEPNHSYSYTSLTFPAFLLCKHDKQPAVVTLKGTAVVVCQTEDIVQFCQREPQLHNCIGVSVTAEGLHKILAGINRHIEFVYVNDASTDSRTVYEFRHFDDWLRRTIQRTTMEDQPDPQ